MLDPEEGEVGGGKGVLVMQLLLLDAGPLWQQTSISEPAWPHIMSNMVGATNACVAQGPAGV